jgi:recombinational DNA repair protein RecR
LRTATQTIEEESTNHGRTGARLINMLTIEPIVRLTTSFRACRAIGQKTPSGLRTIFSIWARGAAQELAAAIVAAREKVVDCPVCGTYTDVSPCAICSDTNRDGSVLCVVCDARMCRHGAHTRIQTEKYHVLHAFCLPWTASARTTSATTSSSSASKRAA